MSESLIQVVDENDQPIRAAGKKEVWKTGARHRIAWTVVEDPNGRILLQKRPKTIILYPDCWDVSAGGHVDAGEEWKEAAERELEEELGIKNAKLEKVGFFYKESEFKGRKLNRFYKTYKLVTAQKQFDYNHHELAEIRWMDVDKIRKLIEEKPNEVTNGLRGVISRYY